MSAEMKHIKKAVKYFKVGPKGPVNKVKDAKYDKLLHDTLVLRDLKSRSASKVGLISAENKEPGPFCFEGFCFSESDNICKKIGRDGKLRSNKYQTTWIYFSKEYMHVYTYIFSMTDSNVTEYTKEYRYCEISDFETYCELAQVVSKKQKLESIKKQYFSFNIEGSEKVICWSEKPIDDSVSRIKKQIWQKQGLTEETDTGSGKKAGELKFSIRKV